MATGGDDDAVRNGGESAKGTQETRSAYKGISANSRCRGVHGATGTLLWACPKTVCRPALALIRRRLGVNEVVGRLPEWSQCIGALHIGARGWAYNQCAQGVESALPELTM